MQEHLLAMLDSSSLKEKFNTLIKSLASEVPSIRKSLDSLLEKQKQLQAIVNDAMKDNLNYDQEH